MTQTTPVPGKTNAQWLADIMPEIEQAQTMLEEALSSDPAKLSVQADIYEDTYCRMVEILSESNGWLDHAEYVEIMKIDAGVTIPRQKAMVNVAVMHHRMLRDKIKGLCQSLHSRMKRAQWRA